MPYVAPVSDTLHVLTRIAGLPDLIAGGAFPDLDMDTVTAILEEAGRFTAERLAPVGRNGDASPARLESGRVVTPPGWREAYADWIAAGWNGLSAAPDHGGQGLPQQVASAVLEYWCSGSVAFSLCPTLTFGAIEALDLHGAPELKARYLAKLVSGEWTGTMNLTEPQAGSDVGALRTRAEPQPDGSYRIFGTKIFITYGDHDFTDNIIHFVLARLPDAPAGTRGISLFLVPKRFVDDNGQPGAANDVTVAGLEHKLGIHGSPTCTLVYGDKGGAVGWLVGEANRGLNAMFTMMNNARLAVGVEGVGIAEAASQHALAYARERRQGRAIGASGPEMSPIIAHPDVQRMLLTSRAWTMAARVLCLMTAAAIDRSHGADAAKWSDRAGLLTPLAKALSTDIGLDVASLGIQVHGGMGFIEETGAARFLRDARITQIYEGTNGIQAIDLVMRKLPLAQGQAVAALLDDCGAALRDATGEDLAVARARATSALDAARRATGWFATAAPEAALAVATPYLRLLGLTVAGCHMLKGAAAARDGGDDGHERILAIARFFAESLMDEIDSLAARVTGAADAVARAAAGLT